MRALCLSLAVLLSLPMLAVEVEIGGINYDLNAVAKQATVIAWYGVEYSGEVVIPESVEHEGTAYSVTSIGESAFEDCSGLTSVTIGNSVTSIREYAFSYCSGLTSVSIGNSVTSIGSQAFYCCSGLTSVSIPNAVTSIGKEAFSGCSGLTSVTIPNSVKSVEDFVFNGCSRLATVIIPNSVTSIGLGAFYSCSALTSVTIPNSVTSIESNAFDYCPGLTSIVVEEGNTVYDSRNNCNAIIETASNTLHIGCKTTVIPNSVTSIGDYAFYYCSGLTSVTIPNSVTTIGIGAFTICRGLTSVSIGNSVTSIGDYAFWCCDGLASVTIGNSVENIGSRAFADCPELLDVYCYAENVPSTESNAFDGSYPEYATLHVPNASVDSYKATEPWSSFGNIVALPNEFNLTVSSAGYATLFLDFNAKIPAAVQAYTGVKVVGNGLKMERVEGVLPANTGVIIKAEEGTYTFAESDATPATIGDNLLYGTVATTQISTDPTYSYYVLSKVDGIVGMYLAKLTDGKFQNNANKAYMMLKKGDLGIYDEGVDTGTEQLSRGFVFDFGEETSVDELKSEDGKVKSAVYDLSGRSVQKAQKGVYIQNGKVVLVR